jgi:hypothetical protein
MNLIVVFHKYVLTSRCVTSIYPHLCLCTTWNIVGRELCWRHNTLTSTPTSVRDLVLDSS